MNWNIFKSNKKVKENRDQSTYGEPYPFSQLMNDYIYRYSYYPVQMRDPWSWKASTLRTLQDVDRVRSLGRWLSETNPWAQALLRGLTAFTINKGFGIKVVGKEGKDNKRLVKQIQELLNEFAEDNNLDEWYKEKYYRDHRDGETFIQLFNDDIPQIRAVEPDQIRVPTGENTEGQWSMGIKHKDWDYQTPEAYCIQYFDNSQVIIPADEMFHSKTNVTMNCKRGITSFYPVFEILQSTIKLLWAWQEGAKVREAIAYGMQCSSDKATIQGLVDLSVTDTFTRYNPDGTSREVKVEQIEPGMVPRLPKGYEWVEPPQSGTSASVAIEEGLRAVAARFNAPPFLLGIGSDSSYASAVIPLKITSLVISHNQNKQIKFWTKLLKQVVELKFGDVSDSINIQMIPPSPTQRNPEEQMALDLELVGKINEPAHLLCKI